MQQSAAAPIAARLRVLKILKRTLVAVAVIEGATFVGGVVGADPADLV